MNKLLERMIELTQTARLSVADTARASIGSCGGEGLTLTFEVDDIDNTHALLEVANLNPPPIKVYSWGARVIHIYDPEGNRIEFWCSTAKTALNPIV